MLFMLNQARFSERLHEDRLEIDIASMQRYRGYANLMILWNF
jgi:hypothetical protein